MKYTYLLALVLSFTFVLVATVSVARANNAAVVIKDTGCGILDGNMNIVFTPESHSVTTSSNNTKFTCKAVVAPSTTEQGAVHWNYDNTGLLCNTALGVTKDWKEVVSPSGQATLQCFVHHN